MGCRYNEIAYVRASDIELAVVVYTTKITQTSLAIRDVIRKVLGSIIIYKFGPAYRGAQKKTQFRMGGGGAQKKTQF